MDRETLHGVVQGNAIHLDQPSSLPAGTPVQVVITLDSATVPTAPDLGQLYGAWAEDGEELDEFVEWSRQQRKIDRRPQDT